MVWTLLCFAILRGVSSFAIILLENSGLIAILYLLSSWRHVVDSVLCLFLGVPWVGLQCVTEAFPGHSHLLFDVTLIYESRKG